MQGYNCLMIYSVDRSRILMCHRKKEPYLGLYNFVGGKIEPGESGEDAAYRELFEETAIARENITLRHLMDFTYYNQGCYVEVWCGRLRGECTVSGDENTLLWMDFDHDFFDMNKFAGEGNIGHMLEQIRQFGDGFLD
ncbi:MAG: NUDIX domain-containing protein [Ruminococcaceae bacterium]|nr:NUDIX domain-containing protein [Oscillospiraceae bacterium]